MKEGPPWSRLSFGLLLNPRREDLGMQYLGIDWAYRRAAWCAKNSGGDVLDEGVIPADEDGLAKLVVRLGSEVRACVEMMSGAIWVRDRLQAAGWQVEVADARKVKGLAPLACKTDKVDARVLAELCRRDLVPAVWLPCLDDRALRERLNRRMHLVRMRTMARNRIHGVLTQWGLKIPVARLRQPDGLALLETHGMPQVWRRSVIEALPSSTGSTDASRRLTKSWVRSPAPTRAWCCWKPSPGSGRCSV
jgi:transposase